MNIREKVQAFVDVMVKVHPDQFFVSEMLVYVDDYCRSLETHVSKLIGVELLAHHRELRRNDPANRRVWSLTKRDFNRVVETFHNQYLLDTNYSIHDLGRILGPVISSLISRHRIYYLFSRNRSLRGQNKAHGADIQAGNYLLRKVVHPVPRIENVSIQGESFPC